MNIYVRGQRDVAHETRTEVRPSSIHGKGLFATRHMVEVNLGPYSGRLIHGDEAETMLNAARKQGSQNEDMLECTELPRIGQRPTAEQELDGPYVLLTDKSDPNNLHRINQANRAEDCNTQITTTGEFIATVAKDQELLTWYGGSYDMNKDTLRKYVNRLQCQIINDMHLKPHRVPRTPDEYADAFMRSKAANLTTRGRILRIIKDTLTKP